MTGLFSTRAEIQDFSLWEKMKKKQDLLSFDLELTARCPQNCRHCYINLPQNDREAKARELTIDEIERIADQAVQQGALWCLLTGGDPLLRADFSDIFLMLKRKGLLVTVFTAATLINTEHIELFRRYPPRSIEVTVYGVTRETYEQVTRCPGSYKRFKNGLDLLFANNIRVRLKAMALRSNLHEMAAIARFCRQHSSDFYRFDPLLHLRYDGNRERNDEIRSERLTPEEIVALEQADPERSACLDRECEHLIQADRKASERCLDCPDQQGCTTYEQLTRLFHCSTGSSSCSIGYDGTFRLCSSLWAEGATCSLRNNSLAEARKKIAEKIQGMYSNKPKLLASCAVCPIVNLCNWCPAHAHLETGDLEGTTPYFCAVAHARAQQIQQFCTTDSTENTPVQTK